MMNSQSYNRFVDESQLEVTGFQGPRNVQRLMRGVKNIDDAQDELAKMYTNLPKQERRRLDYYRYELAIQNVLNNFLLDNSRLPTVMEIEHQTGISRTTIYKHLNNEHKGFNEEFDNKIRKLRKAVIERLFIIGVEGGNVKALTEFLKHTAQDADKETKVSKDPKGSLIQINNIYIDQRTIHNLPEKTKDKLELLLLDSANTSSQLSEKI